MTNPELIERVAEAVRNEMERVGGGWNKRNIAIAAIAAMDTGRPSREAFEAALDHLMNICEGNGRLMETPVNQWGVPNEDELKADEIDAARREVMRLAGYGEEAKNLGCGQQTNLALDQAGFVIVPKGSYIAIKLDPTMPEGEIELRSDVDSVRITGIGKD